MSAPLRCRNCWGAIRAPNRSAGSRLIPARMRPLNIPVTLIHGDRDSIVPLSQSENFSGGELRVVRGGGHFDMVSPHSAAFGVIARELQRMKEAPRNFAELVIAKMAEPDVYIYPLR